MESSARGQAALLPLAPGVYRFLDGCGQVLYLGRATSLRRRAASYWGDLKDRAHLTPMVAQIARVEAVECDSAHEAAWLERNLLQVSTPPWNRVSKGGQEVEVWIKLSDDPRAPGVTVVHERSETGRYFGPYLGGRQVRLAASGLRRAFPLQYTGGDDSGSHYEMARIRGVTETDRATLAGQVAAVLDRDPQAAASLRASLSGRRDAAAAVLSFELAARLQQEIEALDWVTAEQKVTSPGRPDHDVCGWSGGILVSFTFHKGRLGGWTQRHCDEQDAASHVARTPSHWTAFANRTADLAARLTTSGS
jgi:excinuclease ABC subunit C